MSFALRELDAAQWSAELVANPAVHLLQRAEWGQLKAQFGWQPQRIAIYNQHGFCAGAQVLWRSQYGLRVAYVPRGPIWSVDQAANRLLLQSLERLARKRWAAFLRLEPNLLDGAAADQLHSELLLAGYEQSRSMQPSASIHLDLQPELASLQAQCSKGHRADVRRAERQGVSIRVGTTEADLDQFYAIMQATSQRANFGIHSREYYAQAWRLFGGDQADGAARLLIAEREGRVIGSFLVFAQGAEAQYMYSGTNEEGLKFAASHALQWAAITWAKQRGCLLYDFWGIPEAFLALEATTDPAERERLEQAAQATGMAGVYRFKKGWGGQPVRYLPAYDRVFLRPAYWLWQRRRSE